LHSKNPKFHVITKHIELQHHFIEKQLESGEVHLTFCNIKRTFGDFLTRRLPKIKHVKYRSSISVFSLVEQKKVYVEKLHDKDASTSSGSWLQT